MKASIQAVAAEAGVSISTVSRTFAKPNLVLPETRSKVMAAAEKLDYRISRSSGRTENRSIVPRRAVDERFDFDLVQFQYLCRIGFRAAPGRI